MFFFGSMHRKHVFNCSIKILCMQHKFLDNEKLILTALSEVISEKRKELKKSQRIMAFEYGLHKSLISRLENSKNEPKFFSIWKLANMFEMKPSEFVALIEKKLGNNIDLLD